MLGALACWSSRLLRVLGLLGLLGVLGVLGVLGGVHLSSVEQLLDLAMVPRIVLVYLQP